MISYDESQIKRVAFEHDHPAILSRYFIGGSPYMLAPAASEPSHIVNFYYPISEIKNNVYRRTSQIGKHRFNEKTGENLLDQIALTDDEMETFYELCRQSSAEAYEYIKAYSKGIIGYQYDESALPEYAGGQTNFSGSVHYTILHPYYCHEASLLAIDNAIQQAIELGILYHWFLTVLPAEAEIYQKQQEAKHIDIQGLLASVNSNMHVIAHPV